MRRLLYGVFAASFLCGMLTGCATTSTCGSCSTCGTNSCSTCGGGCGGGCGGRDPHPLHLLCHTAGVCDCDHDEDPCAHRAPWAAVRPVNYPLLAKAPLASTGMPFATVDSQPFGAAPVAPQAMPTSNFQR